MKAKIYAKFEISPSSGYIIVDRMFRYSELNNNYESHVDNMKKWGSTKWETKEGYELMYILLEVEFDGRKKVVKQEDIMKSLEKEKLAIKIDDSMFGGFYKPTKKFESLLQDQSDKRKELAKDILVNNLKVC